MYLSVFLDWPRASITAHSTLSELEGLDVFVLCDDRRFFEMIEDFAGRSNVID